MEKGKIIELKCKKCGHTKSYHLNELTAIKNKISLILGLFIFVFGTPLILIWLCNYLFKLSNIYLTAIIIGLVSIPFFVYSFIEKEQNNKIRQFNNHKISE
ncbi:MAG: hypothetical protein A2W99_06720 [Bacteroidetes bacterium GWF2_33_16]|nr:MAG: hypothetical protein A2X00_12155 [Bacteroidetes bacterium GWE2_32_14]OFY04387.1 MAG: hypothetical protein A2W99_06720 [Bacteroidetes bacterium GWF2_33_16]